MEYHYVWISVSMILCFTQKILGLSLADTQSRFIRSFSKFRHSELFLKRGSFPHHVACSRLWRLLLVGHEGGL